MRKIRVLLAEDHTIVRKGILSLLSDEPNIEVVGEAENGRDAVAQAEVLLPDIIVMDHTMPLLNGLEATRQICKLVPQTKVLILTMHTDQAYVFQYLQAGASGYLVKQTAPTELITAIEAISRGESFLSPAITKPVIEELIRSGGGSRSAMLEDLLTEREREVLQLIAEGFTNQAIAQQLQISVKTVGVHRVNLMQKLDLHNLADLTKYAIRMGMIGLDG